MPKTLDDIQTLLTRCGYTCNRLVDVIVATTVATKIYKNPAGENALEIVLTIDHPNHCVAVEVLRAFELREVTHKEAALACLMTAAGRTPLLRPTLEPEGAVGLRIDCTCGRNGVRGGDVLDAVALLKSFVEVWFPQVSTAMAQGMFNANDVPHLNLLGIDRGGSARSTSRRGRAVGGGKTGSTRSVSKSVRNAGSGAADTQVGPGGSTNDPAEKPVDSDKGSGDVGMRSDDRRVTGIGAAMRAAAISEKPGAHPDRLRVLFEFFRRLDEESRGPADQN